MRPLRYKKGTREEFDKMRNCLRCSKEFASYGGARICDDCHAKNSKEYVMHVVQIPKTVQIPAVE